MPRPMDPNEDLGHERVAAPWLAPGASALTASSDLSDVRLLLASVELSEEQSAVRSTMTAFADAHAHALTRSCVSGHFTGSALVLDHRGDQALFLFHRKLQRWLQPGGHADGDANLAAVALREATEETGITGLVVDPSPIDLDIHEVVSPNEAAHLHFDVRFLVIAPVNAEVRGNRESEALRWATIEAADELGIDAGTHRLFRAAHTRWDHRVSPDV